MTKRSIKRAFLWVIAGFGALLVFGVVLSFSDKTDKRVVFTTFKDLLPLFLGIAAAWLAFCVQRRSAYQQQLRLLWSKLVEAVMLSTQYTRLTSPTEQQHREVLMKLSLVIEEVRGVFCNLGGAGTKRGLYPFEPLKDIHVLVEELGSGAQFKGADAERARSHISALWSDVRREILKEFDREEPSFPHSHWADLEKGRVYDEHGIERTCS
jgi:hypothetical protein